MLGQDTYRTRLQYHLVPLGTTWSKFSSISCTTCPQLTLLASFPVLTNLTSVVSNTLATVYLAEVTFAPVISCTGCDSLLALGDFTALSVVTTSGPTAMTTFAPILTCTNCSLLLVAGNLPLLTSVSSNSALVTIQLHSASALFQPEVTCTNCEALTSVAQLPLFPGPVSYSSYPNSALAEFYPAFACTNCPSITAYVNLTQLTHLPASTTAATFECLECPHLTSFLPYINPLVLNPNLLASSFTYTCSFCGELEMQTSGLYVFQESVPTSFSLTGGLIVGLKFQNIAGAVFPVFGPPLSRLTQLLFDNVAGMTDFDFLWQVTDIDLGLSVSGCPDLLQIEGLRNSLVKVQSALFVNNVILCPNRLDWLTSVVTEIPIFTGNGADISNCPQITPVTPAIPSAFLFGSNIHVSWVNPAQPSIFVRTDLLMNGIPILSFTQAQAVDNLVVTQTNPGASYNFLLVVSLDSALSNSNSVSITVPLVTTGCQSGWAVDSSTGNCTACLPGTFQSSFVCVPCQRGSYSNKTGSYSLSDCLACQAGRFAPLPGATSCQFCNGDCEAGSMTSGPSSASSSSFILKSYDSKGNLIVVTVPVIQGLYYLAAFGGFGLLATVVLMLFKRWTKPGVVKMAHVLRTPFTMLQVEGTYLTESSSFYRGLIGIWVLIGVLVVTAYQIHVFVEEGRTEITAVQPGTTYLAGNSTSLTSTPMWVNVTLYETAANCDSSLFEVSFQVSDSNNIAGSNGVVQCAYDEVNANLLISVAFASLSFTPNSQIILNATSLQGNAVFCQAVGYSILADSYSKTTVSMTETLTGSGALLSGMTADLYAIPTQYQYDGTTLSTGYTYTYRSSQPVIFEPTHLELTVTLTMAASDYFYLVQSVQNISWLQFLAAIIALGGGALTAGSLVANMGTQVLRSYRRSDISRSGTMLPLTSMSQKKADPVST